jgi:imidazolonepropionase-like amidohydrolase
MAALALVALPSAASAQAVAITGGTVYPVSGPRIERGTVIIRDGLIAAVGGPDLAVPAGARRVDATGKWVTPGLIDSYTQLGLVEIGQVADTRDMRAQGEANIAASFPAWEGLNPNSVLLAPARKAGVTSFVIVPTGGLVAGQAAMVDAVPGTAAEMVVKTPVAMVAEVGNASQAGTAARGELMVKLRQLLDDTRFYQSHRDAYDRGQSRDLAERRIELEAMIPVLQGRLPLLIAADRASDIDAAFRLARDYSLKIIIGGGAEGWMRATELAAAHVPVLTGAMNNIPSTFATLGQRQENAGILSAAGVPVAMIGNAGGGDEEAFNVRNIRFEAGNAVAYGMTWDNALKAVTLWPAEMFGVADQLGSLAPGRVANVVVWSGDPFEFATRAERVWVRGVERNDRTRQDLLTERYLTLPPR